MERVRGRKSSTYCCREKKLQKSIYFQVASLDVSSIYLFYLLIYLNTVKSIRSIDHRPEPPETLPEWITEESEYQVKAVEIIEGLGAKYRRNCTITRFKRRRKPEQNDERLQEQYGPQ